MDTMVIVRSGDGYFVRFIGATPEMTSDPVEAARMSKEAAQPIIARLEEAGLIADEVKLILAKISDSERVRLQASAIARNQKMNIYFRQLKSIIFHKWHVLKVGLKIGGIPLWRLIIHDWSKFAPVEFINYSRYKYGVKDKSEWAKAWLHHLHLSAHHPEHWLLSWRGNPSFYDCIGESRGSFTAMLAMPETYVREMVADFMATSKELTGSYDISYWLSQNGAKMLLHYDTEVGLDAVMTELGYVITDNCKWSYVATDKAKEKFSL